ncbi:hypothetical protein D3C76_1375720 [compost metagenome]
MILGVVSPKGQGVQSLGERADFVRVLKPTVHLIDGLGDEALVISLHHHGNSH